MSDYPDKLTLEEELALARRYRNGDAAAGQLLVSHNMRFVVKEAYAMAVRWGHDVDDLIQEGALALLHHGLPSFSPDMGVRFISFVGQTMRHFMIRAGMMSMSPMDNKNTVNRRHRWMKRKAVLCARLGREATDDEVYESLGWRADAEAGLRGLMSGVRSLNRAVNSGNKTDSPSARVPLQARIADAGPAPEAQLSAARDGWRQCEGLEQAIRSELTEREQFVIRSRWMFDGDRQPTLADVASQIEGPGGRMGISRERVRQIERDALEKLRGALPASWRRG